VVTHWFLVADLDGGREGRAGSGPPLGDRLTSSPYSWWVKMVVYYGDNHRHITYTQVTATHHSLSLPSNKSSICTYCDILSPNYVMLI